MNWLTIPPRPWRRGRAILAGLLWSQGVMLTAATAMAAEGGPMTTPTGWLIGGCGGAYFLAEPGDLRIDLRKQNRQPGRPIAMRAVLVGPDRTVLADEWLPAGTPEAPWQTLRLSSRVEHPGLYGLMISAADDRYGNEVRWGFTTNCRRYLVETSRGHRDARHQEPLVLASPERPGEVVFMPRRAGMTLELSGLARDAGPVTCVDAAGTVLATLTPGEDGRATHAFAAAPERARTPWVLRFPRFQGEVNLDGLTRWDREDDYPGLSLWTPDAASWFALHAQRWLLTPYSRTLYGEPGREVECSFRVHHNGLAPASVTLALELPASSVAAASLSPARLTLEPQQAGTVTVRLRLPAGGMTGRLRATADGLSTYSTITLREGAAPALAPLTMPLVLRPYQHENELFGYAPDYPVESQPYADLGNQPWVAGRETLQRRRAGAWATLALPTTATGSARPRSTKIAFDAEHHAYTIGTLDGNPVLLHAADGGGAFEAAPIAGLTRGHFDLENFSGHNLPAGPPPLLCLTRTARDPKLIWRSLNDLHLILPERRDGRVVVGEPILITRQCIGFSDHSGIPSTVVSRGTRVHVIWGEATDPAEKVPGVPTYVVTYDRARRSLGTPTLIGYGPPANDGHNTPCITMDSQGYLHALVGTHGRTFKYARSLQPNDSAGGWTPAEDVGTDLRQTYVGLVCDPQDTLHLVFRLWQEHGGQFPAGSYACLAHMTKPAGQPWSTPRPLVIAPFTDYSVFYHRLTIDRRGQLFLSYDYWSTYWFYRNDHVGSRRALLVSPDAGTTWKLADDRDFAPLAR